jgi:lactate permease
LAAVGEWSTKDILGEAGISGNFQPLYLPGGILVFVCLVTMLLHRCTVRLR